MRKRRVIGLSLAHISREIAVSTDQLRASACAIETEADAPLAGVFCGAVRLPSGAGGCASPAGRGAAVAAGEHLFRSCGGVVREGAP